MKTLRIALGVAAGAALVASCARDVDAPPMAAARASALGACADLGTKLAWPKARFTAMPVAAGELAVAGRPVPAHCRVTGTLNERSSAVEDQRYAIGFEMRLPEAWNGRFFYQANGGVDGNVVVEWVENGRAPGAVVAQVRGPGNAAGVNADLPAAWSATRSRPLCPYPSVARYDGSGDPDSAASFSCR